LNLGNVGGDSLRGIIREPFSFFRCYHGRLMLRRLTIKMDLMKEKCSLMKALRLAAAVAASQPSSLAWRMQGALHASSAAPVGRRKIL
jgi:hypothetical protein